jgi:hypothetical protein
MATKNDAAPGEKLSRKEYEQRIGRIRAILARHFR